MPGPSNSWVTNAALTTDKDGNPQITLDVQVDDFNDGENVEISGQATQEGGAFANYYAIQPVPLADKITGHKIISVSTHPIPPNQFMEGLEITIVMRVSKVWVTVLGTHQVGDTLPDPTKPGVVDTTIWTPPLKVSSIDGVNKPPW